MKTKLLLLLAFINYVNAEAQFGSQQIITTNANGASSVYAVDLDGDGDIDVLSASVGDSKIAWYENTDGLGKFGSPQIITTNAEGARTVYASDIDADGDMDVLSSSLESGIAWYENTDGLGSFGSPQNISTEYFASSVYAVDLDGDGDMDVITSSDSPFPDDNYSNIAWYENTDGQGSFGSQQIITTDANGVNSVYAIDIDGDEDMDVLASARDDNSITWYENTDGQGSFGLPQIITINANGASSVYAVDLDGDGDMDVLSASIVDNKIAWYENTDGLGSFGSQQIITTNAEKAFSVYATDLDGDGDMDVLSASFEDDKIAWYKNTDGLGSFGSQQIITTNADNARSVFAADINGNGDMDVLSASYGDDKIAWYENSVTLSVNENSFLNFSIYPIPAADNLTIHSKSTIVQVEIYNEKGQLVMSISDKKTIDISELNRGLYLIKAFDINGNFGVKRILKK
jgi:hypothetical protein